jgi:hypothetical protein
MPNVNLHDVLIISGTARAAVCRIIEDGVIVVLYKDWAGRIVTERAMFSADGWEFAGVPTVELPPYSDHTRDCLNALENGR